MFVFVPYRDLARPSAPRTVYDAYPPEKFPQASATKVPLRPPSSGLRPPTSGFQLSVFSFPPPNSDQARPSTSLTLGRARLIFCKPSEPTSFHFARRRRGNPGR